MVYVYASLLTVFNLLFWVAILFGLPGTWLMVLLAAGLEWWLPGEPFVGLVTLYVATGLAVVGEVLEFAAAAGGARQAGGTRRGALFAIAGGIVGAVLGTPVPVPVLGTLVGACIGAFIGSIVGDLAAGRPLTHSVTAGQGAAAGRFWGTLWKLIIGGMIGALLSIAAFL